jgi:iron complex transport system substrate-binding protein
VEAKTAAAPDVKVFVQISKEPLFTVGESSFLTDLINRAGGVSVTADVAEAYPKFSKETALALQPEVLILSDSEDNREPNEVFKNSPAMKNGRVFRINPDLLSRPSPRLVDALEQIAKDLHPEGFR